MYYCSLAEAKSELIAKDALDDKTLQGIIQDASSRIDLMMSKNARRPYFGPWAETRQFILNADSVSTYLQTFNLPVSSPLLSYSAVSVGGTALSNTALYPPSETPARGLRITDLNSTWYTNQSTTTSVTFVSITGVWGYHADYSNAWPEYDTLAAAISTTTATSMTVNDVDGSDPFGFTPRFSEGQLLLIDSEYIEVTKANAASNTLTIRRGANGSTAATHSNGASIKVWQVDDPVRRVVARQSGLLYARRGAYQVETIDGVGTVSYPQDLLTELWGVVQGYQYV